MGARHRASTDFGEMNLRILVRAMAAKGIALVAVLFLGLSAALLIAGSAHGDDDTATATATATATGAGPATAEQSVTTAIATTSSSLTPGEATLFVSEPPLETTPPAEVQRLLVRAPADDVATVEPPAAGTAEAPTLPSSQPAPTSESALPTYTAVTSESNVRTAAPATSAKTAHANADVSKASQTSGGMSLTVILLIMAAVVVVAGGSIGLYLLNRPNAGRH